MKLTECATDNRMSVLLKKKRGEERSIQEGKNVEIVFISPPPSTERCGQRKAPRVLTQPKVQKQQITWPMHSNIHNPSLVSLFLLFSHMLTRLPSRSRSSLSCLTLAVLFIECLAGKSLHNLHFSLLSLYWYRGVPFFHIYIQYIAYICIRWMLNIRPESKHDIALDQVSCLASVPSIFFGHPTGYEMA